MTRVIPHAITAMNLVFGLLSLVATMQGNNYQAALMIFAAAVADGLDGRAARLFKVSGEFGKELDSLGDVVSFGVAPAVLAYAYLLQDLFLTGFVVAGAFAICGALRLARFNINAVKVKGHFMGLPIPAAGCTVAACVIAGLKPPGWWFPIMVCMLAYLMISTVRYPDFKGKGDRIYPLPALIALFAAVYSGVVLPQSLVFVPFLAYILLGIANEAYRRILHGLTSHSGL